MAKQKGKKQKLIDKLLNRYRLVIINETTFEEQLYFRMSRLNVIMLVVLSFAGVFILTYSLIAYTPLREMVPGKASSELNKNALENRYRLDSITEAYQQQAQYLAALKKVLVGDVDALIEEPDTTAFEETTPLLENVPTNTADSLLRAKVAQEDKYNLSAGTQSELRLLLFPPAKGLLSQEYNPNQKHYAVDIVLSENTPIKAIAEGTVIFAEWTAETGYVIMLEHLNGLLSIYKHNASLTKAQGDLVQGGEVIATAGNTGEYSTGYHLHFELWADGYPMNPTDFIDFTDQ